MTRDEILRNVQVAIKKTFLEVDLNNINIATQIQKDLGADSMGKISFMMELEDQFGAALPIEQAVGIENIGQIVDVIDQQAQACIASNSLSN
jgi:acyl carrier protein